MRSPHFIYRVSTGAAVFVAGVVLISILFAYHERRQAERLLSSLNEVRVGTTNQVTAIQATEGFRRYRTEYSGPDIKQIQFLFNNIGINWLRLARYTEFRVYLTFKDGILVGKYAVEAVPSTGYSASVEETVRGFGFVDGVAPAQHPNHIVLGATRNAQGVSKRIIIRDDNSYGDAGRRQDWEFNLACLTRFGGCGDARLFLPHVIPAQASLGSPAYAPQSPTM
jgi:hypothetical protein